MHFPSRYYIAKDIRHCNIYGKLYYSVFLATFILSQDRAAHLTLCLQPEYTKGIR
jgi:hypothetical protein